MNRMLRTVMIISLACTSYAQLPIGHQRNRQAIPPQLNHVIPAPQNPTIIPNQPAAPSSSSTTPKKNKDCSICMSDIESSETPSALPCAHTFHTACIHQWLATNDTCPECRTIVSQIIVAHNPVQVAGQHRGNYIRTSNRKPHRY